MDLKGKRILVTGGHGFLGGHVVEALTARGARVTDPRRRQYDLRRLADIRAMLYHHAPEIVVHLAARVGGIGANAASPASFFYDNLMMGVQLLHECCSLGVSKFVTLATVCSYPKYAPVPFREESLWDGYPEETNAPYGLAKKMLIVQSQAYRQQYGYNAVVLVPVNLYGPRDNFDFAASHVIPAMIRKFVEAKTRGADSVTLWGDGTASREFLYVEDCARAICLAVEGYDSSDPVNLGTGAEITMLDLAAKIRALVGYEGEAVWDATRPNGQPRRCLDVTRARERFGFEATTTLDVGLQRTLEWHLSAR